jgi:hypothetical protein
MSGRPDQRRHGRPDLPVTSILISRRRTRPDPQATSALITTRLGANHRVPARRCPITKRKLKLKIKIGDPLDVVVSNSRRVPARSTILVFYFHREGGVLEVEVAVRSVETYFEFEGPLRVSLEWSLVTHTQVPWN